MKFTLAKDRSIELTNRDLRILQHLQSSGAKTSADLANHFWDTRSRKAKAGFRRIRLLIKSGLLERGNPQLLYLSERAKGLLSESSSVQGRSPNESPIQ